MTALETGRHMLSDRTPGNVVSLRTRNAYRPDLAALAREQVTAARNRLDQTHEEFAETLGQLLGWTPKPEVIRGWETTATPPGDVILAAGLASQNNPDVLAVSLSAGADKVVDMLAAMAGNLERITGDPDVQHAYATRRDLARRDWQGIISGCTRHVWLDGMAEQGYANDDDVPGILERASSVGCDIRVLLLDPDYPGIHDIDADEGNPPGTLAARIRGSLHRFRRMAARCGDRMQVRTYDAPPTVSIVRGDDRMLVTPYIRFLTGGDSPTFLLEQTAGGQMFSRYERHFDRLWTYAEERAAA